MGFDFNESGKEYQFLTLADKPYFPHIINEETRCCLEKIGAFLKASDDSDKKYHLSSIRAKINSLLCSVEPFILWNEKLSHIKISNDEAAVFFPIKVWTAFDNFLYQARAILDRLSYYLNRVEDQAYNQKYSKLLKSLHNQSCNLPDGIKNILNNSKQSIVGTLVDVPYKGACLRNRWAHQESTIDKITHSFAVMAHKGKTVAFDAQILNYPIFSTVWDLLRDVLYTVFNILSFYNTNEYKHIRQSVFLPVSNNQFINSEVFVANQGVQVTFYKADESEVHMMNKILSSKFKSLAFAPKKPYGNPQNLFA
jgi:hypothetical protein